MEFFYNSMNYALIFNLIELLFFQAQSEKVYNREAKIFFDEMKW